MRSSSTHILRLDESPEKLLDSARVPFDRMPMLRAIFERAASQCTDVFCKLLPAPAVFSLESLATERIGNILGAEADNKVIGIMHVPAWDSWLLIGLRNDFIFAFADASFGGDGCEGPFSEERPLSNIEVRLAEKAFNLIGNSLQEAFAAVCKTDFVLVVKASIKVRIMSRDITLFILIPQSALDPVRRKMDRDPSAKPGAPDLRWSSQIKEEVGRAQVSVRGVIEKHQFTLADIAELRAGQVMLLQADAATKVNLECNAEPLFWCELGQAQGFYTLRAGDAIGKERNSFSDAAPN